MIQGSAVEPGEPVPNPLDPTYGDLALTVLRAVLSVATGPAGALVAELAPSATSRQQERAIRSLQLTVQALIDRGSFDTWDLIPADQQLNAALVRALRAAEESATEQKRQLIWYGLINGWVRTTGNPERDRFQRIVAKYELEHFQILKQMQGLVTTPGHWFKFESGTDSLVSTVGRDRDKLLPYLQEFAADGLVMLYDQPDIKNASNGPWVQTIKSVLWKHDADRLLEFVSDPRNMLRATLPTAESSEGVQVP